MIMENKSLAKNAVYYGIKTVVSIIFPLITYKYASHILGAENVGKVEFAKSFVSYFLLVANLGINAFAIRNGSGLRDDKKELEEFSGKVFGINCVSAGVAVGLFILIVLSGINVKINITLGLIFLVQIPLNLIGVDWIFNIYEDFKYITYRSFICQALALGFMFTFVRTKEHFVNYAIALVIASHGAYIFSWIRARKLITIRPVINKSCVPLLAPIIVLFANSVATSIYVSLDISMLGFMKNNADVGIYSAAVKVYTAIKSVLATTLLVALPRMSYYSQNGSSEHFNETESKIVDFMLLLVPACMTGVILQSKNLILFVSGSGFEDAGIALVILGVALLFSSIGMVCGTTILLPDKKEKIVLISTVTGAVSNFVLNLFFIPWRGIYGAAITTLISEFIVSSIQMYGARYRIKQVTLDIKHTILPTVIGTGVIIAVNLLLRRIEVDYKINLVLSVTTSVIGYFIIAILFKNSFAEKVFSMVRKKGKT